MSSGGKRDGAGRPKGRMNNRTEKLLDRFADKYPDWCPLEQMIQIANEEQTPVDLKVQCCSKVAAYLYSKPKSEIAVSSDTKLDIVARLIAGRKQVGLPVKDMEDYSDRDV